MSDKLETWAVVELFGHDRIAGYVTEQEIAGSAFVRVDVPEVDGEPGFSKLFGPSAIYSLTPVSEDVARAACVRFAVRPLGTWTPSVLRSLPPPVVDQDEWVMSAHQEDDDEIQRVHCNECGEYWPDSGSYACPYCGSDDTV
jgi:hypothetical protein